jgi:hypothetical protein
MDIILVALDVVEAGFTEDEVDAGRVVDEVEVATGVDEVVEVVGLDEVVVVVEVDEVDEVSVDVDAGEQENNVPAATAAMLPIIKSRLVKTNFLFFFSSLLTIIFLSRYTLMA